MFFRSVAEAIFRPNFVWHDLHNLKKVLVFGSSGSKTRLHTKKESNEVVVMPMLFRPGSSRDVDAFSSYTHVSSEVKSVNFK